MTGSASRPLPWWASAVFYQIYPRSFADGNGDGTGDLVGVRERLDHLVELGVDALWISPFYRSPMADGGYDVADPCDVDPMFGTLADFDALLAAAHARDVRITIDMVPNHFSDQHPWFQGVLAGDASLRDRFVIRPGRGSAGERPPNNWPSQFGGPAWTRLPDGEWYLHLFAPEQPDLNWENPAIPAEFERVMRFWLDKGVDGFRIDVAHSMAKPAGLPDLSEATLRRALTGGNMPDADDVRWDQDGVHEFHRLFRRVLDAYPGERMAVGETWVADPNRLALYVRPDELNLTFNFELVVARWGASAFRAAIDSSLDALTGVGAPCTWVLSNHDVDRVATRYGGGAVGVSRARAAALVQLSLPGAAYLYNGDELGLENVDLPDDALQDPTWERSGHADRGRDGERVPLPWSGTQPPYGFTTGTPWLPMPAGWATVTAAAEADDRASTLQLFRAALALRRAHIPAEPAGNVDWLDAPRECLSYRRGPVTVLVNLGTDPVALPPGDVLVASGPIEGARLPRDTAVWLTGA